MNELVEDFWTRALKIARQYEAGEVDFADLTGLGEEFAASFTEGIAELPEQARAPTCSALENVLQTAITSKEESSNASEALNELLMSINRTPIY
ncbi:MAG TPA: hypothetical protein VIP51_10620 [Eoetvoesiella sp.]